LSKIRSKISSIEADDDVVSKALGLHPVDESTPVKPVAAEQKEKIKRTKAEKSTEAPMPAIVSRPARNQSSFDEEAPRWPHFTVLAFGLLWLIGSFFVSSSIYDFGNLSSYSAGQLGGLIFLIFFPLLLLGVAYYALRQLAGMTHHASRLDRAANSLMQVDETVVRRATEMSGVVKKEIDTLNLGIDTALTRASTLQGVLDEQTEKLGETGLSIEDKTQKITEKLSTEREALWSISNTFEEQMKVLTASLDTHSENLALSTKTAEQKIQEARLSVENTSSKINQTSDLIRNNTMEAAETLSGNQNEILKLSDQLKHRAEEIDSIYQKHSEDLGAMIAQLKNEQEVLSHSLEERLTKMRDMALSAQVSAERLTEASEAGRKTVLSLSEAAQLSESTIQKRFADLEQMVEISNSRAESINEKAARRVQDSLAQTRKEISRIETDMMDLQEKLSSAADSSVSNLKADDSPSVVEDKTEPAIDDPEPVIPPKKSSGTLKLRPAEDLEDTQPSRAPTTSGSSLVAGLRPAPKQETEMQPELSQEPKSSKPDNSSLDLDIEQGLMRPATRSTVPLPSYEDDNQKSWLKKLFGKNEPAPRRIMPREEYSHSQEAPSLAMPAAAAVTATAATAAISSTAQALSTDVPMATEPVKPDTAHAAFLSRLSGEGLSPDVIVDNGCIMEAVDNRINTGTKAMSVGVAARLGDPIRHFANLMENDQSLKAHVVGFAVKFHHSLTSVGTDKAVLQRHLQSEDGRLFLMCDAALNGR